MGLSNFYDQIMDKLSTANPSTGNDVIMQIPSLFCYFEPFLTECKKLEGSVSGNCSNV